MSAKRMKPTTTEKDDEIDGGRQHGGPFFVASHTATNIDRGGGGGGGDGKLSGARQLLTELPVAVVSLAMSYNKCADYVAVWRAAREMWPVLRLPAASPADCRVQNLAWFLDRVDPPRPSSSSATVSVPPLPPSPSPSSSPPVDDPGAKGTEPKYGSVAPFLRPRRLQIVDSVGVEQFDRLRRSALAPFIRALALGSRDYGFAPVLVEFPNLRHVHGAPTLTPERKKSTPWSASDWLGPYDVCVAPRRLACYQTQPNVRVHGLAPFADCRATLTSLGCVSLYTQAHVDELQRFAALQHLRCALTARSDTGVGFLDGDSLFRGDSEADPAAAATNDGDVVVASLDSHASSPSSVPDFRGSSCPPPPLGVAPRTRLPPLAKLDIAVETDAFRVQQLAALAPTLRSLRLKRYAQLGDMRGLAHLTRLTELVLDSNGVASHQYALPSSVTGLVALGYPSALLAYVDPKSLAHVTHVRLVQSSSSVVSALPVALCHMTALQNLSIAYPRTGDRKSTTRIAPIRVAELAALPRTIRVFDYAGPPCADFTPLREWPELHTLAYRLPLYVDVESSHTYAYAREPGVLPSNCVWPPLRALRSLTVWHYWHDAPELFPALREFYFLSRSPLAMAQRPTAIRRFAHLERFEPDAKPSDYASVQHEPEHVCDAICCCCSRSAF